MTGKSEGMIVVLLAVLCAVLALGVLALALRLQALRRGIYEIEKSVCSHIESDTNTLIDLPVMDRAVRKLVITLNVQLKHLREERRRYQRGGAELKDAVTNISHDLRTPLTAVCGYLELLEREPMSQDQRRYLDMIENRVMALRELTEELFRYSVAVSEGPVIDGELVDLGSVLEESLAAQYPALAGRGIKPAIAIPEKPVMRRLDRRALARCFGNIIGNAVKYSGGDLSVTLTEDGTASFQNTAPGLDEVSAGRLFDRFFTVESGRDSTGLGLSIAKELTERMGGEVTGELSAGRLTIRLCFPAASVISDV